jgi:hypothetical protein
MSMGLLVGFVIAYPMHWWLVANHLKQGMMTVREAFAMLVVNPLATLAPPSLTALTPPRVAK